MQHFKHIPFARVECNGRELELVQEVLASGWLTTGNKSFELEHAVKKLVGADHACAVSSCTAALHLSLEALGVGPGDKVLVPTWTFTATAEVVRYLGAELVFLDVDPNSCLLTPEIVEQALRDHPGAKALMVVHFAGHPAKMVADDAAGIVDICRQHGVKIIEDAAHALPARQGGETVGSIGDATCFSFYANKTITTGEGGMITTNDKNLLKRFKTMRLHGINRDVWNRFREQNDGPSWEYDVVAPGFKYNMPDICAAVGLAQIERIEEMRLARQRCAEIYFETLRDISHLQLPWPSVPLEDHAWHLFPIVVTPESPVDRDEVINLLWRHGISTSVHYKPLHRLSYYRNRYSLHPSMFPKAESVWQGCLSLPIFSSLSAEDCHFVARTLTNILRGNTTSTNIRTARPVAQGAR